ncbi:MAG: Type-1 restriction enzyme EcoKI specificity protein [Syntrophorhabdus sp. PtaU1.Bin153]|nr:MAG: Type-1 restriction enzyme EcoKI specificity protein [Syntrophorhabdus sp. PtaU1.Bin153]
MGDVLQKRKLSSFLTQVRRQEKLEDDGVYRLLGVKWYGRGVFVREEKKGKEIKTDRLYRVKTGDFIYNRLFAWKSSFAIIPEEFSDCLVSNEFPLFTSKDDSVDLEYLLRLILLPQNIDRVNRLSGGMSSISRKRFKEDEFLNFEIPSITIEEQRKITSYVKSIENNLADFQSETERQAKRLSQLRQAILQEAIEGKLTAEWRAKNPIRKGDPDTDAAALLAKIKAEKQKLIAEVKIKKEKPLAPIKPEEIPFDLPKGWVWCRLGRLQKHYLLDLLAQCFTNLIMSKREYP